MLQNKEREILETAARMFQARGFGATSIRDIAQAAGVQKAAIYHYVRNKEELLRRIFSETAAELNRFLEELLGAPMSNPERLRQAIHTYLTFVVGRGAAITVAFRDARGMSAEHREWLGKISQIHMQLWDRIIQAGMATGEFRAVEARMASFAILGACSWMHAWYSPKGPLSAEEIARIFADLFMAGLASQPPSQNPVGAAHPTLPAGYLAELPVRCADVDPTDQIQIPVLVQQCQAALEDLFAACGWPYDRLRREHGLVPRIQQVSCELQAHARAGDRLRFSVDGGLIHPESVCLHLQVRRMTDGEVVAWVHLVQEAGEAGTVQNSRYPAEMISSLLARLTPLGVMPG